MVGCLFVLRDLRFLRLLMFWVLAVFCATLLVLTILRKAQEWILSKMGAASGLSLCECDCWRWHCSWSAVSVSPAFVNLRCSTYNTQE